jgi:uncharacterized iron-regulated protein
MIKSISSFLIFFYFISVATKIEAQNFESFKIFNSKGKEVDFSAVAETAEKNQVVFFGEFHNQPVCHWLQIELTKHLFNKKQNQLVLGAEMFEADQQLILNEYLAKMITEKSFQDDYKWWPNYKTDYKPLIEFAKKNQLKFIATNIPRRYASIVYKEGFEGLSKLSADALKFVAPLPIWFDINVPSYKAMLDMGMHGGDNLPKAQAIKDATMAYYIAQNVNDKSTFLHFNGAYHSDNKEGIVLYLNKLKPDLKIMTISTLEKSGKLEPNTDDLQKADFIIVVNENFTKTH